MVQVKTTVTGLGTVQSNLSKFHDKSFPKRVERGLIKGGLFLLRESQKIVPLLYSPLLNSGRVTVRGEGYKTQVIVHYGTGAAGAYAVEQHENLQFRHAPGRKAKYLEGPAREKKREIFQHVANEVKL